MIKPDRWIREMARTHRMIEPFAEGEVRPGVISYGVSSYGYDIRVADEFKVFTNVNTTIVDPKRFDTRSFVDVKADECIIPPNSFALARTVEYFRIPRDVCTVCVGKCLTSDTRVVDAETGDYLSLRDFVDRRAASTMSLEDWKLRPARVAAHLANGVLPTFRVTTRAGLTLKATATHPFRTYAGWTPLADLRAGDRIAVARSLPVFGHSEWPEHEATLLGFMLADGQCFTPGHSPRFTSSDAANVEAFAQAALAHGCAVSRVGRYGYNLVNRIGRGGTMTQNRASGWLASLGCDVPSRIKAVPSAVFTARRPVVAAFLRALFSGDGSAYASGAGLCVEYTSLSERLVRDVRHLLLRFGVFSLVRSRSVWTGDTAWRVQITDKEMIARFATVIGFTPGSAKQERLEGMVRRIVDEPKRRSNFDTLPREAWVDMRQTARGSGRTLASFGVRATQPAQSLSRATAVAVAESLPETEFAHIVGADVVWDTIESITPAGPAPVFDLTVPESSNFVAEDVVVHNSTYARCGIILNVTPFEPEWEGYATLEISNTTPLPAKIYANEGIAQVLFFQGDGPPETSYRDKKGKYQAQVGIVLPRVS